MEGCKSGLCQCLLSEAERYRCGLFLEVNFSLSVFLKSITSLVLACLRVVVCFTEGPLREVPLY